MIRVMLFSELKWCIVPGVILASAGCSQVPDDLPREAVRGKAVTRSMESPSPKGRSDSER